MYHTEYLSTNIQSIMNYKNIYISSIYDYMKGVLKNEWFKLEYLKRIECLFKSVRGNQYHLFHYILTEQILLDSKIMDVVNDYAQRNFDNKNIIGVQIRTGRLPEKIEKRSFFYQQKEYRQIQQMESLYNYLTSHDYETRVYVVLSHYYQ